METPLICIAFTGDLLPIVLQDWWNVNSEVWRSEILYGSKVSENTLNWAFKKLMKSDCEKSKPGGGQVGQ